MITLGGHPLLIEDHTVDLNGWMQRFQSLEDLRQFGALPVALNSERKGSRNQLKSGVGLPVPNYTAGRQAKLNSLYWPTGAARWAHGLFLADGETKDAIVGAAHGSSSASRVRLEMGDEQHATVFVDLWLLPPHQISGFNSTNKKENLWLMPLVDDRYWWQFYDIGDFEVGPSTTWGDVYEQLASIVGHSITVDPWSTNLLHPDPVELTRRFDNVGVLLDAVAHSLGHRIIFRFVNNTFYLIAQNPTEAAGNYTSNLTADAWALAAGGEWTDTGHIPEQLTVTFPKYSEGVPWCNGDLYSVNKPSLIPGAKKSGTFKTIHSSAYADFTNSSSVPRNDSALNALATSVSINYFSWLTKNYDYTFNGIKAWLPNGYDDCVEWTFARQLTDGRYQAQTRIVSQPHNFGVEQQCSQHFNWVVLDHFQIGKMLESLEPQDEGGAGYANVAIWDVTAGNEQSINFPVRAYGWPHSRGFATDQKVWLHWHCDENAWYVFPIPTEMIRFELDQDKKLDESPAYAYRLDQNLARVGERIQVYDTVGQWHGLIGYQGWAQLMDDSGHFEILFLEAPARFIEFKLLYDLEGSAQAQAEVLHYWGAAPNGKDPGSIVTVYDRANLFPHALTGAHGYAIYDEFDNDGGVLGKYIVIQSDQMSPLLNSFTSNFCSDDPFAAILSYVPMMFSPFGQRPRDVTTALNLMGCANESNEPAFLVWDEAVQLWIVEQGLHKPRYVVLQTTIEQNGCAIQIRSVREQLAVMTCGQFDLKVSSLTMEEMDVMTDRAIVHSPGYTGPGSEGPTEGTCEVRTTRKRICALRDQSQTEFLDTYPLEPVLVMQDIYVDGICIGATVKVIYVECSDQSDEVQPICGSTCESGSHI